MKENEMNSQKDRKRTTRNNVMFLAAIALLIISGVIVLLNKNSRINELTTEWQSLNTQIETRDSVINDLDGTISEIEQNLTFIKNKRGQLELEQMEGSPAKQERIIEDIALMNTMLEESEKEIEALNDKLASSNVEVKSFRDRIARLTSEVKEQNNVIAGLKKEIEERDVQLAVMDEKVNTLETEMVVINDSLNQMNEVIVESTEKILEMDHELHKAYWTYGTFRELKEHGVVSRDGGILGILGTTKSIREDLNDNFFTELDIRNTTTIPLHAKRVDVISEHSDSSYQFVYEDDLIAFLEIRDPEEFWKLTKYAVIEVKK
jgi:predicted  nucleic acid-binding Zn-ribbon protein